MVRIFIFCIVAATASGATAQSLVGKWDCQGRDGPGTAIRTLQDYRANGLFVHHANLAIGDKNRRMDASVILRGAWSVKGNLIIENIRTARMTALKESGRDISRTVIGKRMGRDLPKSLAGSNGTSRTRIKFTHPDRFEIISGRIRGICARR